MLETSLCQTLRHSAYSTYGIYIYLYFPPTFRCKYRVNAANRTEAYCSLAGLPSDVLIRGEANQNRAVEGDVVAVQPLPLHQWFTVYKESAKVWLFKAVWRLMPQSCLCNNAVTATQADSAQYHSKSVQLPYCVSAVCNTHLR